MHNEFDEWWALTRQTFLNKMGDPPDSITFDSFMKTLELVAREAYNKGHEDGRDDGCYYADHGSELM
jgi:hypothetical protein